jgi:hypothetical protein
MTFLEVMHRLASDLQQGGKACMRVRDTDAIKNHEVKSFLHRLSVVMSDSGRQIDETIASAPTHVKDRLAAVEIAA